MEETFNSENVEVLESMQQETQTTLVLDGPILEQTDANPVAPYAVDGPGFNPFNFYLMPKNWLLPLLNLVPLLVLLGALGLQVNFALDGLTYSFEVVEAYRKWLPSTNQPHSSSTFKSAAIGQLAPLTDFKSGKSKAGKLVDVREAEWGAWSECRNVSFQYRVRNLTEKAEESGGEVVLGLGWRAEDLVQSRRCWHPSLPCPPPILPLHYLHSN